MEVESTEAEAASEKGEVVDVEVLVEAVGVVCELGIVVFPLHELVDEVEGWYASEEEEE